jgi:hypothetical protein
MVVGADGVTANGDSAKSNNPEEMEVDSDHGTENRANEDDPVDISVGKHAETIPPPAENCAAMDGNHENSPNTEEAKNVETPEDLEGVSICNLCRMC